MLGAWAIPVCRAHGFAEAAGGAAKAAASVANSYRSTVPIKVTVCLVNKSGDR
jgi:hypothetical protein